MAQDRWIEIISAKPSTDRRNISIRFKITDPNPNARYNIRAYLQSPETKSPQPIDTLHEGLEAKDYTRLFAARGKDGKYFKDGTYNLRLGAVTILNGKPFTIQHHVEIRLGQPAKPAAEQKAAERRIEIKELKLLLVTPKQVFVQFQIFDPSTDRQYHVSFWQRPADKEGEWVNVYDFGLMSTNPKEGAGIGATSYNVEKYPTGKYWFAVIAESGNIKIQSDLRIIEIKSQPAKKAEEFQVLVTEIKPKGATIPSQGVPVGTTVDYQVEIKGGEPEFIIERIVIYPDRKSSPTVGEKIESRWRGYSTKFNIAGPHEIKIVVKDKNGKEARANIPVYVGPIKKP